ncbi:MAG TPA: GNAT family N-acetyltransferase [Pyrinomonadaceae bacterium]|nr:GNAT family N-acetyltransferase [Pyrinomonadaceae bacterium]
MFVNLLGLAAVEPLLSELRGAGVLVRRAQPWELTQVRTFIKGHFEEGWADEVSVGFVRQPVSVFVAVREGRLTGFAAYECTRRNFVGPMGLAEGERGRGVGRALLLACLWALREMGYVYAILGGIGPVAFFERAVGATVIPDSSPGIYADPLRREDESDET